jgi:hypothetical protein
MGLASSSHHDDRPRWSLYLVALVCFGPLALIVLLGLLVAVPTWIGNIAEEIPEPERFSNPTSGTIWDDIWPILLVVSGLLGLIGLFRLFALVHHGATSASRKLTLALIVVGLTALLAFDLLIFPGTLSSEALENWPITGLAIYLVLPFLGAAWLLLSTWKWLSPGAR